MRPISILTPCLIAATLVVAGCASDGAAPLLTTQSLPNTETAAEKKVADSATMCRALNERIVALRNEGTVAKVEEAGTGKSRTVVVKRAALLKVAELNQANAEFQAKCSKLPQQAAATPGAAPTVATAAAAPAKPAAAPTPAAPTNGDN